MKTTRRSVLKGAAATAGTAAILSSTPSYAQQVDAAKKWVDSEFQPSTLSKDQQMAEMEWFIKASTPFKGMKVSCVSEILSIHEYESKTLTKAFADITGIQVNHEMMDEGLLVDKIEVEIQSGKPIYDFWMNDSDFIGTHPRYKDIVGGNLTDFMAGDAKEITNPNLDLKDFIGLDFATFEGKLYQLPDQQFANLYWFRYDWFQKPELKAQFKQKYGYELGVPVNWSAYEDIADFFTNHVKEIDGVRVYGHMDYGKKDPSLGWRFTDAWLSMAGSGDRGLPNGKPVDEWGIRMENGVPVGSSITRGGDANGPAAVYATTKFVEWLKKYAPPEAAGMDFLEAGAVPGQGHIAQQIFWYSAFTHALSDPKLPVMNADGTPKWRMAPSPHGAYWKEGMKLGYQDVGCWTMLKYAPMERVKAGWLYAQFCVSKTVTLKKSVTSLHVIRESDIWSDAMTKLAPKVGGLVEFYRSPARKLWTPTGVNVPEYGKLAQVWWQNVSKAISGEATPQQAMDGLARDQDAIMTRLEKSGAQGALGPKMNPEKSAEYWYEQAVKDGNLAPQRKLPNEKPKGETIDYDELLKTWAAAPPPKKA
ncbi:MAG TPA: ABC transporter substrate-binding protein [Acetobacteraceae bacterium]|jgi:glycerol transport system substrate-binding protein|nr:ABC transporter substrate-binding protein [Acetobacteraceae bacterium]